MEKEEHPHPCKVEPGGWSDISCHCKRDEGHEGLHQCGICSVMWYDDGREVW